MSITVDEVEVADPAFAWTRAGFSVDSDAVCRIGGVRIRLTGRNRGAGIVGWSGITYVVADIDATAAYFGDPTAPVKDAVQPGRRITTLRHDALGLSVRSAMISAPARR